MKLCSPLYFLQDFNHSLRSAEIFPSNNYPVMGPSHALLGLHVR